MKKILGKTFVKIILAVAIVCGIVWAVDHFVPKWDILGFLKPDELRIEDTDNVVTEIRKIAEFTSACYYEEMVLHYSKESTKLLSNKKDEIVILAKGKVRAGFDLSKLRDEDIAVAKDTLTIVLPKAQVLDVIVNPSNIEVFDEQGNWSHAQVSKVERAARQKLRKDATEYGLLDKATTIGIEKLTGLFQSFGFKVVNISVAQPAPAPSAKAQ